MLYRDRDGRYLTPAEWRRLYCDPQYAILQRQTIGPAIVSLSWVGCVMHHERDAPKLFLVRAVGANNRYGDKIPQDLLPPVWAGTEEEGYAAYDAMATAVRKRG